MSQHALSCTNSHTNPLQPQPPSELLTSWPAELWTNGVPRSNTDITNRMKLIPLALCGELQCLICNKIQFFSYLSMYYHYIYWFHLSIQNCLPVKCLKNAIADIQSYDNSSQFNFTQFQQNSPCDHHFNTVSYRKIK